MNNKFKLIVFLSASLLLVSCGSKETNNNAAEENKGVIPQAQLDALDKAKGVNQTLEDADAKRREEIEKQAL